MVKVSSPAKKAGLVAETTPHATQVPSCFYQKKHISGKTNTNNLVGDVRSIAAATQPPNGQRIGDESQVVFSCRAAFGFTQLARVKTNHVVRPLRIEIDQPFAPHLVSLIMSATTDSSNSRSIRSTNKSGGSMYAP